MLGFRGRQAASVESGLDYILEGRHPRLWCIRQGKPWMSAFAGMTKQAGPMSQPLWVGISGYIRFLTVWSGLKPEESLEHFRLIHWRMA